MLGNPGVALYYEVVLVGADFPKGDPVSLFLLPTDLNVELLVASPVSCLPLCPHTSCHGNKEINL